jgi:hypothetical protein
MTGKYDKEKGNENKNSNHIEEKHMREWENWAKKIWYEYYEEENKQKNNE